MCKRIKKSVINPAEILETTGGGGTETRHMEENDPQNGKKENLVTNNQVEVRDSLRKGGHQGGEGGVGVGTENCGKLQLRIFRGSYHRGARG